MVLGALLIFFAGVLLSSVLFTDGSVQLKIKKKMDKI
jgi:hypothetical protein